MEPQDTLRSSLSRVPQLHPLPLSCSWGGSKKQEMKDCKGNKILLGICPSSHRSEDLLPKPEIFWNWDWVLWDFCWVSFSMSQFPVCYASCHFPCTGFSSRSASTGVAVTELGSCCAWVPLCRGCAEVVSARLNPRNGTIDVGRVCNFLGFASSQQKFEVTDQCYSPQMDQCYSSVLFRK